MKKQTSRILKGDLLQTTVRSFTKGTQYELTVKREFLPAGEKILLIDDFLASGEAAFGVIHLAQQAGAEVAGIGIVIEKAFQSGHQRLATKAWMCIRWHALRLCPQMPSPLQNNQSLRWATAFSVLFLPRIWNWMHAFSVKSAKKANYRCNEQQNMI